MPTRKGKSMIYRPFIVFCRRDSRRRNITVGTRVYINNIKIRVGNDRPIIAVNDRVAIIWAHICSFLPSIFYTRVSAIDVYSFFPLPPPPNGKQIRVLRTRICDNAAIRKVIFSA